eukprot:6517971-Lingulodinium_polyedra.AAC.1
MATESIGVPRKYEQRRQKLDKVDSTTGETLATKLDLVYHYEQADHLADIRLCSPCAGDRPKVTAAARRGGEAAERGVRVNGARYGDKIIPL